MSELTGDFVKRDGTHGDTYRMSDHADTVRDALMLLGKIIDADDVGVWDRAVAALDALVRERDEARREADALRETNHALQRSAIGNRDGRWAAEVERDRLQAIVNDYETLRAALEGGT